MHGPGHLMAIIRETSAPLPSTGGPPRGSCSGAPSAVARPGGCALLLGFVELVRLNRYSSTTVDLSGKELRKLNICLQTLEVGANDRSAQELQNALKNKVHTNFVREI